MSDFRSLIRLHRWQLDEKRRQHGELLKFQDGLLDRVGQLNAQIAAEGRLVGAAAEPVPGYGAYIGHSIAQRETIERSIAEVAAEIAASREAVADAYRELKKFELAEQNAAERQRLGESRRRQIALDELSIEMHRRRATA
jgi:flagellar export protein FliJ